jgi:hypothetical protein
LAWKFRGPSESNWIAQYATMSLGSLLAFVSAGAFASRAYFDLFYQVVATIVILKTFASRQPAPEFSNRVSTEEELNWAATS